MLIQVKKDASVTNSARRAQIVGATIATIAELGYHQASFARIAERANLSSTRLISYHFDHKDG
ncbi:TetR family transcriptional regulator [Nonomuraea terrae]|uniref:TetR family transcriptional regulator n=1 Tax=Nonomuraea terrae TaxID=2530383 RepID=A0A4R4YTY5_9ACTN|nr:TetR family transcriptional regulator [Nonomuraea terrae]TDD47082.1 TetR family transcriptional regulator [Nonomuraea terrae]